MSRRPPLALRAASSDSGVPTLRHARTPSTPTARTPPSRSFEHAPLADYLAADPRPTFVLAGHTIGDRVQPVYVNPALQEATDLCDCVRGALRKGHEDTTLLAFLLPAAASDTAPSTTTLRWNEHRWRRVKTASGWIVVHCESYEPPSATKATPAGPQTASPLPETAVLDWTRDGVPSPTPYVDFLRKYDWASTPLGPMSEWSWDLRCWCNTLIADPFPGLILWGPSLTMIYNQACMQIIGDKHPAALGGNPKDAFGELWQYIESMITQARRTGKTVEHHNLYLPLRRRNDELEETYWTFAIMPIIGRDGRVCAVLDRFIETTSLNIAERRQNTLARLGELGRRSSDLKDLWQRILQAIDINAQTPFAVLYSVTGDEGLSNEDASSTTTAGTGLDGKHCELEGTFGIPTDHPGLPSRLNLADEEHEIVSLLRQAWRSKQPVLMTRKDGTLPRVFSINNPVRGYSDECTHAVVIPVQFSRENSLLAFMIHALNPRRPYDSDYKGYIQLLQTRIVELAASVFLPEDDRRMQAALREETLRQTTLASRLLSKTHEAEQKQHRFMRLAENAPIGMVMYDAAGSPLFYNDAYFETTGQDRTNFAPNAWVDAVHPDDRTMVMREWRKLIEQGIPVTVQHRVVKPWVSVSPVDGCEVLGETWLLLSAFPEITGIDGSGPPQILGWVIDISHQKWAEKLQRERLEDALEKRRQSENFIDMTSHEMRNPLSAILQSADGIHIAMQAALAAAPDAAARDQLQAVAENARTIVLCAQHQKRIVDDILTLSKLDSNLLLITPDIARPRDLVRHALKMYEAELQHSAIAVNVVVDPSYTALDVNQVLLDPSRVLQVLINLLTNAIKFTQFQPHRRLTVYLAASRTPPTTGPNGAVFFPRRTTHQPAAPPEAAGDADPLYVTFAVQDTGRGLSADERKTLFRRFLQANPRTHVQYGGSGLGLFISRELTELQGGQVGVASELGTGSTFAFYIVAYPCQEADDRRGNNALVDATSPPILDGNLSPSPATSPGPPPSVAGPPAPLHVLIVEDNLLNQQVTAKQLAGNGCVVHVANHGGEALDFLWKSRLAVLERNDSGCDVTAKQLAAQATADPAAASAKPALDVVLLDLEMPVMDGLTCIREIRALQRRRALGRHVPVICTTANAREAQVAAAHAAGCDLVVTKPFRIPELLPQMQRLVATWRAREAAAAAAAMAPTEAEAEPEDSQTKSTARADARGAQAHKTTQGSRHGTTRAAARPHAHSVR